MDLPWILLPMFFLIAALYSSVGHGGASGYLALFALAGLATPAVIPVALVLNIAVAAISFFTYWRSGHFSFSLLLPFIVTSIPAAYIGGRMTTGDEVFRLVLGLALLAVAARMLFLGDVPQRTDVGIKLRWLLAAVIGLVLGLVSGMVGIGGGVLLSPLILLLGWADVRQTAAVSSAFIVMNSVSGLLGHVAKGVELALPMLVLVGTVVLGGLLGSWVGAQQLHRAQLRIVLGVVLAIAAAKLILPWVV